MSQLILYEFDHKNNNLNKAWLKNIINQLLQVSGKEWVIFKVVKY